MNLKRIALAFALLLLPTAAMAQHHDHHAKKETSAKAAGHVNFAQELIAAKAQLNLTADQITKLHALSAKMDDMHKRMASHHATAEKASHADMQKMESKLHEDVLSVFTEEQVAKVKPMMKAHMEKCEHMKKEAGKHH